MSASTEAGARSTRQKIRLTALRLAGKMYRGAPAVQRPQSVLLIRPDHLGDMLLLTPALRRLREALPAARVALLAGPWSAEVVRHNPDVDEVLTVAFPGFERGAKRGTGAPYRTLWLEARQLRERGFDAAVILRFDHWWGAWLTALAGIPRRIGYAWPETAPFLTEPVPYVAGPHEALQNATLLQRLASLDEPLGPTHFAIAESDQAPLLRLLAEAGVGPDEPLAAIHPGAGAAVKQWPVGKWARVAKGLHERYGVRLVVTGGPSEQALAGSLAALLPAGTVDLAGRTTLGQLAALFARCRLVLGADSGPLHLAVATGTPTVHLYGPVPAAKFGPWGDSNLHLVIQSQWACVPCDRLDWPAAALEDHGCIVTMDVERVLQAAFSLMEERS